MPLSPQEAAKRVNEHVTLEMLVKAAKNCGHCSQIFLDSEEDHHDPKNMAVAVTGTGKGSFKEAKIDDPAGHFKGQVIRVTGVVTLKANRPQIEVDDPRQIEIVEKNKNRPWQGLLHQQQQHDHGRLRLDAVAHSLGHVNPGAGPGF